MRQLFQLLGKRSLGAVDSTKESLIGGQQVSTLAGIQVDQGIQQCIKLLDYFVGMSDPTFGRHDPGCVLIKHQANNQRDDEREQKAGQDLSFNGAQSHELP